jgi:hypothetical protein
MVSPRWAFVTTTKVSLDATRAAPRLQPHRGKEGGGGRDAGGSAGADCTPNTPATEDDDARAAPRPPRFPSVMLFTPRSAAKRSRTTNVKPSSTAPRC